MMFEYVKIHVDRGRSASIFVPEGFSDGLQVFPQFVPVTDEEKSLLDLVSVLNIEETLNGVKEWEKGPGYLKIVYGCSEYEIHDDETIGLPFAPMRLVERRNTCRERGLLVGETVWSEVKSFQVMFGEVSMPTRLERIWQVDGKLMVRDTFVLHALKIEVDFEKPSF